MQDTSEPVGGFFAHMATMGEDYWHDCLTSGTGVPLLDLLDAEYEHYETVLGLEPEEEKHQDDMDDVYPWSYPPQPPEPPAEQLYMVEPKKTIDHTYLAMRVANSNSVNNNKRSRDESSSADESTPKEPPRKKRAVTLKKSRSLLRTTVTAAPSTSSKAPSTRKGRGRTVGRPDTPQSSGSEAEEDNVLNMAPPGKVTGQYLPALNPCNVLVDHNYQSKAIKPDLLGVQTPSDSEDERLEGQQLSNGIVLPESSAPDEEEIDVVSVNGISSFTASGTQSSSRPSRGTSSRFSSGINNSTTTTTTRAGRQTNSRRLPTNPTTQTRRGLEVRLGTLITTAHRNIHRRIMDDEQLQHSEDDDDDDDYEEEVQERLSAPKTTRRRAPASRRSRGGDREDKSVEDKNKKRCMHNDMERLRRVDLKNSFDNLKVLVPSIASTSKCAKVTILKESKLCVNNLHRAFIKLDSKRAFLKTEQEIFRDRLKRLRSSLWNLFRVRM